MDDATPRLSGDEGVVPDSLNLSDATVLDFWQWGFSNLRFNDVRGVFAEWLVGKLLGIPMTVRGSWDEYDLATPEGVRLEVKAAAYLQAWPQKQPSKIGFSRLKGRVWNAESGYASTATCNADLYVFCVQTERDPDKWNALDLGQWRFYQLTRNQVEQIGCASISLSTLSRHAQEMTATEFVQRAGEAIRSAARTGQGR